jgi:hypothetical protein
MRCPNAVRVKQVVIVFGAAIAALICGTTNSFDFIRAKIQLVLLVFLCIQFILQNIYCLTCVATGFRFKRFEIYTFRNNSVIGCLFCCSSRVFSIVTLFYKLF